MRLRHLLPALLLFSTLWSSAQDFGPPKPEEQKSGDAKPKEPFWSWSRVYGGGGLGMQFGRVTFINLAPDVGYRITDRYSAGIGLRYIYFRDNYYQDELNIYGGSLFNRFLITEFLFAHGEYELLNGPWDPYSTRRFNINNVWLGGGLRQHVGNSSFNIMALWNVNEEKYNPFPSPQIRMGISIGI